MLLQVIYHAQVRSELLQAQCRVLHASSRLRIAVTLGEGTLQAIAGLDEDVLPNARAARGG